MKLQSMRILASISAFLVNPAIASTYSGVITDVVAQPSPSGNGSIRVSVEIPSGTASCSGNPQWYAFEYPSTGTGAVWTSMLLAAMAGGQSVEIDGNITCDAYGVEGVNAIHFR